MKLEIDHKTTTIHQPRLLLARSLLFTHTHWNNNPVFRYYESQFDDASNVDPASVCAASQLSAQLLYLLSMAPNSFQDLDLQADQALVASARTLQVNCTLVCSL